MTKKRKKPLKRISLLIILFIIIIVGLKVIPKKFYPLKYEDSIIEYSEMYNVDPNLVAAVIKAESRYNAKAQSNKGAMGLMQIMPETGEWIAQSMGMDNFQLESLWDPDTNIKIGTWYLSELSNQFDGEYDLVIAAYNGGPGNVNKWLNDERYSKDGKTLEEIPFKETKNYVKGVSSNHRMYKYLYNLSVE